MIERVRTDALVTVVGALVFVLTGVFFALGVPIGEAPDEPAHFAYAQHVAGRHALPPPNVTSKLAYEGHQPPLDYIADALVLAVSVPAEIEFTVRSDFDAHRAGSRFFDAHGTARAFRTYRIVRMMHLLWGLLTFGSALAIVRRFVADAAARAVALAALLAPQLIFISSMINNDAALIALSTATLLALLRFLERPGRPIALTAGALVTLALFAKGSALFLVAPLALAVVLRVRTQRTASLLLAASAAAGLALWFAMNLARGGTLLPTVPSTGGAGGSPLALLARPSWVVTLFRSFWAKFGAMNTALPLPFYGWFAALSFVCIGGVVITFRRAKEDRDAALLLSSALAANLVLVLLFMLRVDWQPQGRYLLPSIGAVAAFLARGGEALPLRARRFVAIALPCVAAAVAIYSAVYVGRVYAT